MGTDELLEAFRSFLASNGNSKNVASMYWKRARAFLERRPGSAGLGAAEMRGEIEAYIASLPANSGLEVTRTALRYLWQCAHGEPWRKVRSILTCGRDPAIEAEAAGFAGYLESLGRLKATTVRGRARSVELFLHGAFPDGGFDPAEIDAELVSAYIRDELPDLSAASVAGFCTDVRSYARWLDERGYAGARSVLELPLRGPRPHRPLRGAASDADIASILAAARAGGSPARDEAMLLLMANLGLRACDVAGLDLDDIDWAAGAVHVRDSKSMTDRVVPLDEATGAALERYVVSERPQGGASRALFLRAGGERGEGRVTHRQVRGRIGHLAAKSGATGFRGTHTLRRAVASAMCNAGAPVQVVADVLGHEDVKTTMGYLRVDAARLSLAASPWPEGGSLR